MALDFYCPQTTKQSSYGRWVIRSRCWSWQPKMVLQLLCLRQVFGCRFRFSLAEFLKRNIQVFSWCSFKEFIRVAAFNYFWRGMTQHYWLLIVLLGNPSVNPEFSLKKMCPRIWFSMLPRDLSVLLETRLAGNET